MEREKNTRRETIDGTTRRTFLTLFGAAAVSTVCPKIEKALAQNLPLAESRYEKGWYYTLGEMRDVYEREYNGEKILKNTIQNIGGKWIGTISGEHYEAPAAFIESTVGHVQELFDERFIRFLFRLDAAHAHAFIPKEKRMHYDELSVIEETRMMMRDPSLGILFHTAEHLQKDQNDPEVTGLCSRRNFIGWYDGKDMTALPVPHGSQTKATGANTPGQDLRPFPKFAAHKDGAFSVTAEGKEIRFDISLDDDTYY